MNKIHEKVLKMLLQNHSSFKGLMIFDISFGHFQINDTIVFIEKSGIINKTQPLSSRLSSKRPSHHVLHKKYDIHK